MKKYGMKKSGGGTKNKGQIRGASATKSWDGKKQARSTKNKGFGPC